MPLRHGSSPAVISANVAELVRAGHEPKQAVAIAHAVARRRRRRHDAAKNRRPAALTRTEEQYASALVKVLRGWITGAYGPLLTEAPKLAAERAAALVRLDDSPAVAHRWVAGVDVSVELCAGDVRHTDYVGDVTMPCDYGYLAGALAADGASLDVLAGPDSTSTEVFVVQQLLPVGPGGTWVYFQDKVVLGYQSREEALAAFVEFQAGDERYAGMVREISPEQLRAAVDRARAAGTVVDFGSPRMDSPEGDKMRRLVGQAGAKLRAATNKPQLAALAQKFAEQTSTHQRRQLHDQLHDALGVDPEKVDDVDLSHHTDDFVRENVALISRIPPALHADVEELVSDAVRSGRPHEALRRDLQERFDVSERHARLIARDQIGKYYADVGHARMRGLGVRRAIWHTVEDERVRDSHAEMDGVEFDLDDPPVVDGEAVLPGEAIQCFPGTTQISSHAPVTKLYRRRYRGEGAVLKTEQGRVLTSTSNHPILTQRGWIAAKDVEVGDHVVEATTQSFESPVVDGEYAQPMIEEVFRALRPLGAVQLRPCTGTWFHGDAAFDEEVDVVDVDRSLRLEHDPQLSESFCQDFLTRAYQPTLPEGSLDLLFVGLRPTATDVVRGANQLLSTLLVEEGVSIEHRRAAIARLHAVADELGADGSAADAEVLRHALDTPPLGVELVHHVARVVFSVARRAIVHVPRLHAASAEELAEAVSVDAEGTGDFRDGAGRQQLTRVVEKSSCELDLHVFNLETESEWYVAQGLIVHNCRCFSEPILEDLLSPDEEDEDLDEEPGDEDEPDEGDEDADEDQDEDEDEEDSDTDDEP